MGAIQRLCYEDPTRNLQPFCRLLSLSSCSLSGRRPQTQMLGISLKKHIVLDSLLVWLTSII